MIFGFNTDVKHEGTIYHVQSEARENELLLQTQVFDRLVLDSIRDGRLDDVLDKRETPETLATIKELDLQWLNADSVHSERNLVMRLRVTEGGSGVQGARLTVRFARPDAAPFYTQVVTDPAGDAQMKIELDESSLPDSSVLVQANYSGRTATRKFQLRKVEA